MLEILILFFIFILVMSVQLLGFLLLAWFYKPDLHKYKIYFPKEKGQESIWDIIKNNV